MLAHTPHDPINNRVYRETSATMHEMVQIYLETGVAVIRGRDYSHLGDDDHSAKRKLYNKEDRGLNNPAMRRKYMRLVAKEERRPIVFVELGGWYNSLHITIPRLKRTQCLTTQLLLVSDANKGSRWRKPNVCSYWSDKTNHYFNLMSKDGQEIFDAWFEQCRTNPAFRTALKAPQ